MKRLARCDNCIVRPETCHHHLGTCREPDWAETHCMRDHVVYLANSSGLKVGITRGTQVPTRWIDQGARQALPLLRVKHRYLAGLIEASIRRHVSDRTDWRRMLKGDPPPTDLQARAKELLAACADEIAALVKQFGDGAVVPLAEAAVVEIGYPVSRYPEKVTALNFDKHPEVEGTLSGIKGQYLILDTGVLNVRKFEGYAVAVDVG
jgi:hypothetical protein